MYFNSVLISKRISFLILTVFFCSTCTFTTPAEQTQTSKHQQCCSKNYKTRERKIQMERIKLVLINKWVVSSILSMFISLFTIRSVLTYVSRSQQKGTTESRVVLKAAEKSHKQLLVFQLFHRIAYIIFQSLTATSQSV